MINFFANLFGYVLNFIYNIINNYGLAIILFSILLKLLLLPLSIKQQKTLKKSQKIQGEMKVLQERYKNDQEKLNQEMMALYKRENMNPFSGCLSSIIQLIFLLSMFYLVRSPLTYMKKVDNELINNYKERITLELGENSVSVAYPEISILKYINNKIDGNETVVDNKVEENKNEENVEKENTENAEIENENNEEEQIEEENKELEIDENLYINMNFLGLDLNSIPKENYKDFKVFIIPILYIVSSIISIKLTQNQTQKPNKKDDKNEKSEQEEMSEQMNKSMTFMMPILAVSVSVIAPLGLALYWLVNNILMIVERIIIDKYIVPKEEEKND